jgi:hypothetical protein
MPRWPPTPMGDKPLSGARQALRQREREQKAAAKRAAETPPAPPLSGPEYVTALRKSVDARTKRLDLLRRQFERVAGNSSIPQLDQLAGMLSLYERRTARRNTTKC